MKLILPSKWKSQFLTWNQLPSGYHILLMTGENVSLVRRLLPIENVHIWIFCTSLAKNCIIFKCGIFQGHILIKLDFTKNFRFEMSIFLIMIARVFPFLLSFFIFLIYWVLFHCYNHHHHHPHHTEMTLPLYVWVTVWVNCERKHAKIIYHSSFIMVNLICSSYNYCFDKFLKICLFMHYYVIF